MRVGDSVGDGGTRSAPEESGTFAFGRTTIALGGSDRAAIAWLLEFFGPALRPTGGQADWSLRLEPSPQALREWRSTRPSDATSEICFVFDSSPVQLPVWKAGETVVIDDCERGCVILVEGRTLTFIGDTNARRWRFAVVLTLQELMASVMRETDLQLHAGAVETGGSALVIAGSKAAGKTTVLIRLLSHGGWSLMSNDRVFVTESGGAGAVQAMPVAVNLRDDTVAMHPELRLRPRRLTRPYLHSVAELEAASGPAESVGKRSNALTPAQLADSLGIQRTGQAGAAAFVFPEVCDDISRWVLDRLPSEETATLLEANLHGIDDPPTWFSELAGAAESPPKGLADRLAATAPGLRLRLGRGSLSDDGLEVRLRSLALTGS